MKTCFTLVLLISSITLKGQNFSVSLFDRYSPNDVSNNIYPFYPQDNRELSNFKFEIHSNCKASLYKLVFSGDVLSKKYLNDKLYALVYEDSLRNKMIYLDLNYDSDFTNDAGFNFKTDSDYNPMVFARIRKVRDTDTLVQYLPFTLRAYDNRLEINKKKYELTLTEAWYKEGKFSLSGKPYILQLKQQLMRKNDITPVQLKIKEISEDFSDQIRYNIEDTVTVEKYRYIISQNLDKLDFTLIDSINLSFAPDFTRKDFISGKTIKLSNFLGKYVLLDFWGSWCVPCLEEIPNLKRVASLYADKLEVISIAFEKDENLPKLKKTIESNNMNWHHIKESWEFDNYENLTKKYAIKGYPTFILIDKNGGIVFDTRGNKTFSQLETELSKIQF